MMARGGQERKLWARRAVVYALLVAAAVVSIRVIDRLAVAAMLERGWVPGAW